MPGAASGQKRDRVRSFLVILALSALAWAVVFGFGAAIWAVL
jgi:hypothetical protein